LREKLCNIISNILLWILPLTYLDQHVKIVLIIDNATWHNQLTEYTIPLKKAWRKEIDEAAKKYNVDILRLVEFLENYLSIYIKKNVCLFVCSLCI
jgi:hypothetical protein